VIGQLYERAVDLGFQAAVFVVNGVFGVIDRVTR